MNHNKFEITINVIQAISPVEFLKQLKNSNKFKPHEEDGLNMIIARLLEDEKWQKIPVNSVINKEITKDTPRGTKIQHKLNGTIYYIVGFGVWKEYPNSLCLSTCSCRTDINNATYWRQVKADLFHHYEIVS